MAEFATLRHKIGLDISQTANFLGMDEETLCLWESGLEPPDPDAIRRLRSASDEKYESRYLRADHKAGNNIQDSLFSSSENSKSFINYLEEFNRVGTPTRVFEESGLRYFVNDFWTARQRQAARIHEVSYRACFKAQLPEFFIKALTEEGDCVYDPFMGRGTTPIQSALLNRKPAGNDINPLSLLLTRPRLNTPTLNEIALRLQEIPWGFDSNFDEDLLTFYHPETLRQILALRIWLQQRERAGELDHVDDWIRMVAINRLTGHSTGFFSVYTLPPNQAVSIENQKKINQKRDQIPPQRDVPAIILKKSKSLLSQGNLKSYHEPLLGASAAHDTPFIDDASVDLVVTSPPFLDVVQYAADNWLRCWFAGIDAQKVAISMHRTPEAWTQFVRETFNELARVVKSGGHVAFEVGEVRNGSVLLEREVDQASKDLPFDIMGVLVNEQEFTKTSNCWGVSNNKRGTNTNRVLIFKRR